MLCRSVDILCEYEDGSTIAHKVAAHGHVQCLKVIHDRCASILFKTTDHKGWTPAHYAAHNGHTDCLRVLHEVGATASLSVTAKNGMTPAHSAAQNGHADCLRVLHEVGLSAYSATCESEPGTCEIGRIPALKMLDSLCGLESLTGTSFQGKPPATIAAEKGNTDCLVVLQDCDVPITVMDKRTWLAEKLAKMVDNNQTISHLDLNPHRQHLLDGLCVKLGINEKSGALVGENVQPLPVSIRFQGENAVGDGVRREWFELTAAEILDKNKGLFTSKNGIHTVLYIYFLLMLVLSILLPGASVLCASPNSLSAVLVPHCSCSLTQIAE